jgi:hypothetical protein
VRVGAGQTTEVSPLARAHTGDEERHRMMLRGILPNKRQVRPGKYGQTKRGESISGPNSSREIVCSLREHGEPLATSYGSGDKNAAFSMLTLPAY